MLKINVLESVKRVIKDLQIMTVDCEWAIYYIKCILLDYFYKTRSLCNYSFNSLTHNTTIINTYQLVGTPTSFFNTTRHTITITNLILRFHTTTS